MLNYYMELLEDGVPESIPSDGFHFTDLFDELIANNQKTWPQDRRLTVGASEAFSCIRKTWFTKRGHMFGIEKDTDYEENWGAMERGNIIENHHVVPAVVEGLKRRGMELIMCGEGQDTIFQGVTSATLDGLVINAPKDLLVAYGLDDIESDCIVLEMKSFDPRISITGPKPVHEGQTQMQMGLVREETEYQPEYAIVMYVNASWLDDIRCYVVKFDEVAFNAGRDRNNKVFETDDPAAFGMEGKLDGSCTYCQYKGACGAVTAARVPASRKPLTKKEVDNQPDFLVNTLDPLVRKVEILRKNKKAAEKALEEGNEEVRQILIGSNQSRAVGQGWKANYSAIAGRKTLSKAMLEEAGLDPEDFMARGTGYEKLTITVDKSKE